MNDPQDPNDPLALNQEALDKLGEVFLRALGRRDAGHIDEAEDLLREILRKEPRLPEPHMELARILLDTERVTEAEPHARDALAYLASGGQWTDEVPEDVLASLAHALLAEILRQRAEEDDVIFGDPAVFKALVAESKEHFSRAAELDPTDATSSYYAFFLGPRVPGQPEAPGLDEDVDA